jgi:CRP-like cAMP-binding protein
MKWREIWPDLPQEIRNRFDSQSRELHLKRGEYAYRQGDLPKGLYFVEQGLIGLVLLGAASGKEHLMRFFREGQFFGHRALFSNEGYHGSAVALEPTSLSMVPKDVILSAVDLHPVLMRDVARVLSRELRQCESHQVMILENEILVRVAQSLVYLKDLHPQHNWTRQEIANFCASTVSTVIKALSQLEAMGFIRQDGRAIEIVDRGGLIRLQDLQSS